MRAAQRSILAASLLHERVPGFTKSERVFVFCQKYTDLIHFNQKSECNVFGSVLDTTVPVIIPIIILVVIYKKSNN